MAINEEAPEISVIGFFLSEVGLGQSARNIAHSFAEVGVPINCINLDLPGRSNMKEFSEKCSPWVSGVNNFLVSELGAAISLPNQIRQAGKGKREFLYPFWELDRLPNEVVDALGFYDDIFAPSQFIATTFSQYLHKQVSVLHQPVFIPTICESNEPQDTLKIFSFLDIGSFAARKNPKASLDAFLAAFPKTVKDVELILKVRGFGGDDLRRMLLECALKDPRIKIIDKTLDRDGMDRLIQGCNVFLSLHRSEGFGLGPAESLAREKIVISTDYGGTCDFITPETGYPIGYKFIPVRSHEYPYFQNQLWAEPSLDEAVSCLREVYKNFSFAQSRALSGRKLMLEQHSYAAVGARMRALFEERGYL